MKKIDITCPRCKAILDVNESRTEATCGFCGYKCLIEKGETLEEAVKRAKEISYATQDGRNRADEAAEKRKKISKIKKIIITIIVIIFILGGCSAVNYLSKEYVNDPFSNVEVSFSGVDGEGKAAIKATKDDCETSYMLSKDKKLSENETINILAVSNKCRFGSYKKEITVTGLLKYINNLSDINENIRKYINEKSISFQKSKVESGYSFKGTIVDVKPYKIYLGLVDGENILFDISEMEISAGTDNTYHKYVVTKYENVIFYDEETLVKYDSQEAIGKTINAGDCNQNNALGKDYIGFMTGFYVEEDIEDYINQKYAKDMKLYKE